MKLQHRPGGRGRARAAGRIVALLVVFAVTAPLAAQPNAGHLALAAIAVGASGLISVLGNVLPRETAAMVAAARQGDAAGALRLHQQLLPLMDALFLESNPIPLKAALKMLGLCGDGLRLPLVPASAATRTRLAEALCLSAEGTFPGVF